MSKDLVQGNLTYYRFYKNIEYLMNWGLLLRWDDSEIEATFFHKVLSELRCDTLKLALHNWVKLFNWVNKFRIY